MLKNLYIISKSNKSKTFNSFKNAAARKGINLTHIDPEVFDFSKRYSLSKEDAIYRISTGATARTIEKILINDSVNHLYQEKNFCLGRIDRGLDGILIHQKKSLPIMNTIFSIPKDKEVLSQYVEQLGGFPIIAKAMGGMHGVGVMKFDSMDSLSSASDYFNKDSQEFVLRKFIPHNEQARIIVLDNKVIATHTNLKPKQDFRTNVGKNEVRKRTIKRYPEAIHKIAVEAVRVLGFRFGGVDIIFDTADNNKPYIAEVNFPCAFPKTEELSKISISEKIIDFFIEQSKKKK